MRSTAWLSVGDQLQPLDAVSCALVSAWIQLSTTSSHLWTLVYAVDVRRIAFDQSYPQVAYHLVVWGTTSALAFVGWTFLFLPRVPSVGCFDTGGLSLFRSPRNDGSNAFCLEAASTRPGVVCWPTTPSLTCLWWSPAWPVRCCSGRPSARPASRCSGATLVSPPPNAVWWTACAPSSSWSPSSFTRAGRPTWSTVPFTIALSHSCLARVERIVSMGGQRF